MELVAPMKAPKLPDDFVGRESFEFASDGFCTACPKGHAPIRHGMRTTGRNLPVTRHAYFDGKLCRACPIRGRCVARPPSGGRLGSFRVEIEPKLIARDKNCAAQRHAVWWERYKIRSGIEASISELKRKHGLGRLRVRRMKRVKLAVGLKMTACTIKRWLRASCGEIGKRFFGLRQTEAVSQFILWICKPKVFQIA